MAHDEFEQRLGLAALFSQQSDAARENGSPLYADIARAAALDLAGASVLTGLLEPWARSRAGDMLPLRVLGAAHRLVLERGAPALAMWFPSVGGVAPTNAAGRGACYAAWVDALAAHRSRLPELLANPPQTNDPGRGAGLSGMLSIVADTWGLPIRLHELGASAGLNLHADRMRLLWPGGSWGPPDSPLVLHDAWRGGPMPPATAPDVIERVGCDLAPVDVATTQGRLLLTSYTWPDQPARFERLRAAYELAMRTTVELRQVDMLEHLRSLSPVPGTALVVWHSSTWMYLNAVERVEARAAFARLGSRATPNAPVVHIAREYLGERLHARFAVVTQWWPPPQNHVAQGFSAGSAIQYADSPAHGLPVTWMTPRLVELEDM